ncbi:MAG: hypothetical protein QGI45_14935 [Myxococcota bacterium]|jgi:hypothetical protein|nr:hypothetical protein [Myxococcota bacterium]
MHDADNDDANKKVGAQAFGDRADDGGEAEPEARGAAAFGAPEKDVPLKGSLLFGQVQGKASGAAAFGGEDEEVPLKGTLLFGQHLEDDVGAAAFGGKDSAYAYKGALAVGASQQFKKEILKDDIGYNFKQAILAPDALSLSGIKKAPEDNVRRKVLEVLNKYFGLMPAQLERGLSREILLRLKARKDETERHQLLALLKKYCVRAPGQCLGVSQTQKILESFGYLHLLQIKADWQQRPLRFEILRHGKLLCEAQETYRGRGSYFHFLDPKKKIIGYVDYPPFSRTKQSSVRIRRPDKVLVGTIETLQDEAEDAVEPFSMQLKDGRGQIIGSGVNCVLRSGQLLLHFEDADGDKIGAYAMESKAKVKAADFTLLCQIPFLLVWAIPLICTLKAFHAEQSE